MRAPRGLPALGAVAVGALLLSGCAPSTPSPTASAVARTVTIAETGGIKQLNPIITSTEDEVPITTVLYSSLTKTQENGTIAPDLAKSWETSSDGLTWTFTLRAGVKFHDGSALVAQDVVDTYDYMIDPATASQFAAKFTGVKSVEATDDSTVVFHMSAPNPQLLAAVTYMPIIKPSEVGTINTTANGTGPFMLKSFTPSQELVVVPDPNYYGDKPSVTEIDFVTYADASAAERALTSGEVDVLHNESYANMDALLASADLKLVQSANPGGLAAWEVDTTSAPFNNVKARQALAYAADRKAMLQAGYAGYAVENDSQTPVPASNPYYDSSLTDYSFDLQKAKALFAEAGVTEGSTLTFWTLAGAYPEWTAMAQVLQSDLAKIGITLDIESNETQTWLNAFYPAGKSYPGKIAANQLSFSPLPDMFSSEWFGANGTCECNYHGSPAYDAAVQTAASTSDDSVRKQAFDTIQKTLNEDSPVLVLGNVGSNAVVQSTVSGVWLDGDNRFHVESIAVTG